MICATLKENLYDLLTAACQNVGDCNDETYEALHAAVDSIIIIIEKEIQ